MAKLVLDPMCVLSAWEKMGGSAFQSDDVHLDDPSTFNLDLSSWEARLKPPSNPVHSQLESNIFIPLFTPAEMGLTFLPAFCTASACTAGTTETAQVVPVCSSLSAGGNVDDCCDGGATGLGDGSMFRGTDDGHFDDDGSMSMSHFCCEMDAVLSASPTISEAGVVPEAHGNLQAHPNCSTATSGSSGSASTHVLASPTARPAAAAAMQGAPLSHLNPTSSGATLASVFVPVDPLAEGVMNGCRETSISIKDEPELGAQDLGPCVATADLQPNNSHLAQQQQQQLTKQPSAQPMPPATANKASTAVPIANPSTQMQQAGAGPHVRTRAECLERYRQKKARRLYTKKIRYQLRKINADKRPRIKGRFVKKEELEEFLAAQRGANAAAGDEGDEAAFGDGMADSDYE